MQKFGNLNPSIDIIPLQGTSDMSKKMRGSTDSDIESKLNARDRIIRRVQSYMCTNQDKAFINISVMAEYLQKQYGEYKMQRRRAFRAFVRSAYAEITNNINEKSDTSFDQDEDDEVYSDREINPLSQDLVKLYRKNSDERNGNMRDKELVIDISSDDESETDHPGLESSREIEEPEKWPAQSLVNRQNVEQPKPAPIMDAETSTSLSLNESVPNPEEPNKMKKRALEKPDHNPVLKKKKVMDVRVTSPSVKFKNIGGNIKILKTICRLLTHMKHPEIFDQLGIMPPQGFLLLGPPGCGKSLLAEAIAGELGVGMIRVPSPELVAGVSGESESRIREVFEQAIALAPCVLFLDEVDTIAAHRANAQREMERRMVAQLLTCFDEMVRNPKARGVLVLGATNRPEVLDPALRRAGRFDREISLGIPDKEARESILSIHASKLKLDANISLAEIAALTPGYVGADLVELLSEAAITAVNRILDRLKDLEENDKSTVEATGEVSQSLNSENCSKSLNEVTEVENLDSSTAENSTVENQESVVNEAESTNEEITEPEPCQKEKDCDSLDNLLSLLHNSVPLSREQLADLRIEKTDFLAALKVVQPSSKREGFATVPDVTWDDIGSLRNIRQELQLAILAPVRHSKLFQDFGLNAPTGVMLCGPPGCGKTLLAKAIANEAGINFISVKGPELLNMYVGESEKAVRQCFMRARNSAPCVIFFDELDALCPKRSDGDNSATSRVVNQMLTEMDGVEGRKGVYLMAASNRPDIVDPAVLRPGRLDKILYVGLPTADDRVDILKALTKNGTKPRFAANVNLEEIAKSVECEGYSGADLCALVREAATEALRESIIDPSKVENPVTEVSIQHINVALEKVKPSVQEKDAKHYEKLQKLYASVKKSSELVVPMDSPVDAPMTDEAMETL